MASLGHIAVGCAAGRLHTRAHGSLGPAMAAFTVVSLLPDADVIAFAVGIPYEHAFGHRGASHALLSAVLIGALVAALPAVDRRQRIEAIGLGVLVAASHGLLDTLTDGGLGAALLWPFSDARYFAPWRPLPVAPIGAGMFSSRGAKVVFTEALWFSPALLYSFWPRRRR